MSLTSIIPAHPQDRVTIVCGAGGGGAALAQALLHACDGPGPAPLAEPGRAPDEPDSYRGGRATLVDFCARAGLGPDLLPVLPAPRWADAEILVVRDLPLGPTGGRRIVDLTVAGGPGAEVGAALLGDWGGPTSRTQAVDVLRGATRVLAELAQTPGAPMGEALWETIQRLPAYRELATDALRRGGERLLDIARPLLLAQPYAVDCADEWPQLSAALSGRNYAVSDLALCLHDFAGLFRSYRTGEHTRVQIAGPLAAGLIQMGVAPSASEHAVLYHALRDRAVGRRSGADSSDPFVAEQLPYQADKGGVLDQLALDPQALLACAPASLIRLLEGEPARMTVPGFKAYLLSAHRMLEGQHRDSQLELAGRRAGLDEFSLPNSAHHRRVWAAAWARAQAVNVHRVLLNRRSPALSVSTCDGTIWSGYSDGTVWRTTPYGLPRLLWHKRGAGAEVRAVAAGVSEGQRILVTGTSDQTVTVLDAESGEILWHDPTSHGGPLSTVAVGQTATSTVLASAGVGTTVFLHRRAGSGWSTDLAHRHESEIRGLSFVEVGGRHLLCYGAVDGVIGVIDVAERRRITSTVVKAVVFNAISAVEVDGIVHVAAAASDGRVYRLRFDPTAAPEAAFGTTEAVVEHDTDVNTVNLLATDAGLTVLSGASDGCWRRTSLSTGVSNPVTGHAGPIWGMTTFHADGREFVVTAGGEGSCRIWRPEVVTAERIALEQANRHRGGVSSAAVFGRAIDDLTIVTGGEDGDVRRWSVRDPNGGSIVVRHGRSVTAMVHLPTESAAHGHPHNGAGPHVGRLVSGATDGTLRITDLDHRGRSQLLGVAHDGVTSLAATVAGDRPLLASGGLDGTVIIWDARSLATLHVQSACRFGSVTSLCFSGDSGSDGLLVGGQDGTISRFGLDLTFQSRSRLDCGVLSMCAATGSPFEAIAGLADGRIAMISEVGRPEESMTFVELHESEVRGVVCFDLAGRPVIASTGLDRQLILLDLTTSTELARIQLDGHALAVAGRSPWTAIGTSAGAALIEFSDNPIVLISGR
jgi:WD40 repeat protein